MSGAPNEFLSNLYGNPGGQGQGKTAASAVTAEQAKVAQARAEETDFLGRLMAHSCWQELGRLKEAQMTPEEIGAAQIAAARAQESLIGRSLTATKAAPGKVWDATKAAPGKVWDATKAAPGKVWDTTKAAPGVAWGFAKAHPYLAGLAAIPAVAAAGYGGYRGIQALRERAKEGSVSQALLVVVDNEAQKLAAQVLHANNISPLNLVQYTTEQEKEAHAQQWDAQIAQYEGQLVEEGEITKQAAAQPADQMVLRQMIEQRATEMLGEHGFELEG